MKLMILTWFNACIMDGDWEGTAGKSTPAIWMMSNGTQGEIDTRAGRNDRVKSINRWLAALHEFRYLVWGFHHGTVSWEAAIDDNLRLTVEDGADGLVSFPSCITIRIPSPLTSYVNKTTKWRCHSVTAQKQLNLYFICAISEWPMSCWNFLPWSPIALKSWITISVYLDDASTTAVKNPADYLIMELQAKGLQCFNLCLRWSICSGCLQDQLISIFHFFTPTPELQVHHHCWLLPSWILFPLYLSGHTSNVHEFLCCFPRSNAIIICATFFWTITMFLVSLNFELAFLSCMIEVAALVCLYFSSPHLVLYPTLLFASLVWNSPR